jgi:hypothetical protein
MKRILYLLVASAVTGCAVANGETLYPGLTITSATVAAPAEGRPVPTRTPAKAIRAGRIRGRSITPANNPGICV